MEGKTITPKDIINKLNSAEKSYNVISFKLEEINLWPYLKSRLFWTAWSKQNPNIEIRKNNNLNNTLILRLQNFAYFFYFLISIIRVKYKQKETHCIILSDFRNLIKVKETFFDRYTYPIEEAFRQNELNFIKLFSSKKQKFYLNNFNEFGPFEHIDIFIKFFKLIKGHKIIKKINLEGFNEIIDDFPFTDEQKKRLEITRIKNDLVNLLAIVQFLKWILKYVKPKKVILIDFNYAEGRAMCIACKQLNILCIEVQHGVAGKSHYAYNYSISLPDKGFLMIPDKFWCWSLEDKKHIDTWINKNTSAFVGGNTTYLLWIKKLKFLFEMTPEGIGLKNRIRKSNLNIFYSMQFDDLPEWIYSFIIENESMPYTWWIRKHPNRQSGNFHLLSNMIAEGKVVIKDASICPLYFLIEQCNIHITEYSSTTLDAANLNLPTLIINPVGIEYYAESTNSDKIFAAFDSKTLKQYLDYYLNNKEKPDYYFYENYYSIHKLNFLPEIL